MNPRDTPGLEEVLRQPRSRVTRTPDLYIGCFQFHMVGCFPRAGGWGNHLDPIFGSNNLPWTLDHLRCEVMLTVWALVCSRVLGQAVDNQGVDLPTGCRSLDSSGLDKPLLDPSRLKWTGILFT